MLRSEKLALRLKMTRQPITRPPSENLNVEALLLHLLQQLKDVAVSAILLDVTDNTFSLAVLGPRICASVEQLLNSCDVARHACHYKRGPPTAAFDEMAHH